MINNLNELMQSLGMSLALRGREVSERESMTLLTLVTGTDLDRDEVAASRYYRMLRDAIDDRQRYLDYLKATPEAERQNAVKKHYISLGLDNVVRVKTSDGECVAIYSLVKSPQDLERFEGGLWDRVCEICDADSRFEEDAIISTEFSVDMDPCCHGKPLGTT